MADAKITALTALTAVDPADLLAVVDDPGGTPITKKATVDNVVEAATIITARKSFMDPVSGAAAEYTFTADGQTDPTAVGWSWLDQGSVTYLEQYGWGQLTHGGDAGTGAQARGIYRSLPGSWSTMIAEIRGHADVTTNGCSYGLMFRDGTNGDLWTPRIYRVTANPTNRIYSTLWDNSSTINSHLVNNLELYPFHYATGSMFIRIVKNAANDYDFYMGTAPNMLIPVGLGDDPTGVVATVDQFGFFVESRNSGLAVCAVRKILFLA